MLHLQQALLRKFGIFICFSDDETVSGPMSPDADSANPDDPSNFTHVIASDTTGFGGPAAPHRMGGSGQWRAGV